MQGLNDGGADFVGLEALVEGGITFAWLRHIGGLAWPQEGCLLLLDRMQKDHSAPLMHWALEGKEENRWLHNLFGLYRQNGVWDEREVSSEYRPMYSVIRQLERGRMLLHTDLNTARAIVASGLFPIRRVTRSR